jgi:signal transduction histidine kinase/sensor domain CHASE-containing protein/CheY-like chemotaxis protein
MNRSLPILAAVAVFSVFLLLLATSKVFIVRGFEKVEVQQGLRNVERVLDIVQNELAVMDRTVTDWSTWDESYAFLRGSNPLFVQRNLPPETFANVKTDIIVYTASDGRILFGKQLDRNGKMLIPLPASLPRHIPSFLHFLPASEYKKSLTGVLLLPEGPFFISARRVVDSRGNGPSRGLLLMGRRLGTTEIAELSRISHSTVSIKPVAEVPSALMGSFAQLPPDTPPALVITVDGSRSEGYGMIRDIYGKPALLLQIELPRTVSLTGKNAVFYFMTWIMGIILIGACSGVFLYRKLARTADLSAANEQLHRDIEERKRVEEALRKAESIQRIMFEAIPDMLTVIDRDFRIIHSNWGGGYDYVPLEQREKNLHCFDAFYPGQGKKCEPCHVHTVFTTGKPVYEEKYNPRIGQVEVRAYPIFDETGQVVLAIEHIRNITERKKLEEERIKSQKLQSLGVLAGGIAHDFNNILTGIMGNISLAKVLAEPDSKLVRRLEEAEKATQRAGDLTQQLLTFSRGGAPVKKSAFIKQLAMDSVSFVLRGSNVRCDFSLPDDLWPVEIDAGQMNQVFNNMIINADQAMPDGGIISVRAVNTLFGPEELPNLPEGRYVKVSILDQGIGIPEANLGKIFDPYFTTKAKGSGLGLATVYSIIRQHGGLITVESLVGEGTAFHFFLPAAKQEPIEEETENWPTPSGKGKILIMDDEEIIREVAGEILVHLGYKVEFCGDGAAAIAKYRMAYTTGDPFTAVLLDLTIPGGMGGKETMKHLLEIDPDARGIVSSGYSNDPILSHYGEYGFSGVVLKPYDMGELGRTLQEVLAIPRDKDT